MSTDPFKLRNPFFLPAHRRALVTGVCLGWSLLELSWGNPFWFVVFFALGLYLIYVFFLTFDPADYNDPKDERTDE